MHTLDHSDEGTYCVCEIDLDNDGWLSVDSHSHIIVGHDQLLDFMTVGNIYGIHNVDVENAFEIPYAVSDGAEIYVFSPIVDYERVTEYARYRDQLHGSLLVSDLVSVVAL